MRKLGMLAILVIALPLFAQTDQKEKQRPWKLDNEERLARRFNEADAAKRREASESCKRHWRRCGSDYIVDGKQNPELILPWELMNNLTGAYDIDAEIKEGLREHWRQKAAHLNLGADFWSRLYEAGKPFFDSWNNQRRLLQQYSNAAGEEKARIGSLLRVVQSTYCLERTEALAAARKSFGHEAFDEFLYTAVAPSMQVGGDSPADEARWIERGCR